MGIKRLNNFLEKCDALKYYNNIDDYIKTPKRMDFSNLEREIIDM